jgi:hypothetical protein
VTPWGPYIWFSLSKALKKASTLATFSNRRSIHSDLQFICELLQEPEFNPVWSCYIGLLIPCMATHKLLSDVSYEDIIGWSPDFQVMWCLTCNDLFLLGFQLKLVTAANGKPKSNAAGLHINPLEFIVAIVNLWLLLKCIHQLPPCNTGYYYIIDLLSDNTLALASVLVESNRRNLIFSHSQSHRPVKLN